MSFLGIIFFYHTKNYAWMLVVRAFFTLPFLPVLPFLLLIVSLSLTVV